MLHCCNAVSSKEKIAKQLPLVELLAVPHLISIMLLCVKHVAVFVQKFTFGSSSSINVVVLRIC